MTSGKQILVRELRLLAMYCRVLEIKEEKRKRYFDVCGGVHNLGMALDRATLATKSFAESLPKKEPMLLINPYKDNFQGQEESPRKKFRGHNNRKIKNRKPKRKKTH
jgi:hypothetical protein